MGLINLRDLVSFNQYPGANSSDILINGVHLNRTALEFWNYTLYDNNTISNQSACYIIFDQYKPHFLSNGSWVNATSCYVPIEKIGARGAVGQVRLEGVALLGAEGAQHVGAVPLVDRLVHRVTPRSCSASRSARIP